MIILSIRMEVELIFKNGFPEFFSKANHERVSFDKFNVTYVDCNETYQ